jgi:hypothetical protein
MEQASYPMDQEELKYWARRGPKTAAFLLIIPGGAIIGVGVGLLLGQILPYSVIGLGVGVFVWGLIVSLTK